MNAVAAAGKIRRILVELDWSTHSQHALEVAVRLAKWHDAELEGLYVEDIDLVRLATLGVGQEIGPTSPLPRHIEPERLARRLSRGAAEAKRALADTADRDGIRWVFRVERGNVTAAILHAAGSVDIVALGQAGTGRPGPGRLGSTAVALTDQLPRSLIVVQAPVTVGQTVVTVFDASPSCDRAVETAARLCARLNARLVILPTAQQGTGEGPDTYQRAANAAIVTKDLDVATYIRAVRSEAELAKTIREEKPALCIVGCGSRPDNRRLQQLADRLKVSVYFVK